MSAGGGQIPSDQYLDMVKNGIEWCLQNYMNKKEAANALYIQQKIEPWFTELVWRRLENENPEFFKAYYAKLLVKDQIIQFNKLLSEQVERMCQSTLTQTAPGLTSNESHILSTHQIPAPISAQSTRPPQQIPTPISAQSTMPPQQIPTPLSAQSTGPPRAEDMQQLNVFRNNGLSIPPCQLFDWNIHNRLNEVSPDMFLAQNQHVRLAQNQNVGLAQTMKGQTVKPECAGARSLFHFNRPTSLLESNPHLIADASIPRFNGVEPNPQNLHSFLFGLEQFQQPFCPEFPLADFTDVPGGYGRPSFQTMDASNYMDPHHRRY